MTIIRSPIRSTTRSPLRGALDSKFGGISNPLSISAPSELEPFRDNEQPVSNGAAIVFSDTEDVGGAYTVQIDIAGGGGTAIPTFTAKALSGATITADGSASVTIEGTLVQCNAACDVGYAIAGFTATAWRTLTAQLARDADSAEASPRQIILQSLINTLDSSSIPDSTAIGTTIEDIGAPPGALHPSATVAAPGTQTYRPDISGIAVTLGITTSAIDLNILTPDNNTDPTDLSGDFRWILTPTQGEPTEAQMDVGTDSADVAAVDTGFEAFTNTGHTTPEAIAQISLSGLTASTLYYFYGYITMDSGVESQITAEFSFTTNAALSGDFTLLDGTTSITLLDGTTPLEIL